MSHSVRGTTEDRRRSKPRKALPNDPSNPKVIAAQEKRFRRGIRNKLNHYYQIIGGLDSKANL